MARKYHYNDQAILKACHVLGEWDISPRISSSVLRKPWEGASAHSTDVETDAQKG